MKSVSVLTTLCYTRIHNMFPVCLGGNASSSLSPSSINTAPTTTPAVCYARAYVPQRRVPYTQTDSVANPHPALPLIVPQYLITLGSGDAVLTVDPASTSSNKERQHDPSSTAPPTYAVLLRSVEEKQNNDDDLSTSASIVSSAIFQPLDLITIATTPEATSFYLCAWDVQATMLGTQTRWWTCTIENTALRAVRGLPSAQSGLNAPVRFYADEDNVLRQCNTNLFVIYDAPNKRFVTTSRPDSYSDLLVVSSSRPINPVLSSSSSIRWR